MRAIVLVLLLFAGCVQRPQVGFAQHQTPAAHDSSEFVCTPGEHVPDPNVLPQTVRVSYFVVQQSLAVLPYIDNETVVGAYSLPLFADARSGKVAFSHKQGNLRVAIHYPNVEAMPKRVALVGTGNICVGMVPVDRVAPAIFAVDIPIREFAALVFPRKALVTPNHRAWACAQADFPLAYVPELAAGPYKGKPRMLCGLGGDQPKTTLLGTSVIEGAGTLTPLIAATGG